jgi:hypothetical protein
MSSLIASATAAGRDGRLMEQARKCQGVIGSFHRTLTLAHAAPIPARACSARVPANRRADEGLPHCSTHAQTKKIMTVKRNIKIKFRLHD